MSGETKTEEKETTTTVSNDETNNKFAADFKPVFSASKLAEICSPRSHEKTRIKFLRNFQPFAGIKLDANVSPAKKTSIYKPRVLLSEAEKDEIKKKLDESLDLDGLKFDDDRIIDAFDEKLQQTTSSDYTGLEFLMKHLTIKIEPGQDEATNGDLDDDGTDSESAYLTAQSDEECFKKYCDKEEIYEAKSKQAVTSFLLVQ